MTHNRDHNRDQQRDQHDSERSELRLFVFIDAFGWNIFNQHQGKFLADELRTAQPLETVLGYSCACDPTILTGLLPQRHGHFSFYQFAPERSPFRATRWMRWLPQAVFGRGRVRHHLSKLLAQFYGFDGYFQLYNMPLEKLALMDYSEKRDLYQPGGILSGDPTVFDVLREQQTPFHVSDWRRSERENFAEMERVTAEGTVRWAYLYLADLDGLLHRDGAKSKSIADHIQWYDQKLRQLLATARGQYDDVSLTLFSDHGMTDVKTVCDLQAYVNSAVHRAGLQFGEDYAAVYDSTMARFWFLSDRAESVIREELHRCPDGKFLDEQDLRRYGCCFPNNDYGDAFFLLDPGVLLCPSDMGKKPIQGMHGYAPDHPDSTALFASTERLHATPGRLDKLFDFMTTPLQHIRHAAAECALT